MAALAFVDRVRVLVLSEDFEAAQKELEKMRCCVFEDPPTEFSVSCRIHFLTEEEPERQVSLEVTEQMTFGLLKNKLQEKFGKLADFRLTVIVGKFVPLDTATLQMHKLTSEGGVIFVLVTPRGAYADCNKGSVNGRYDATKELDIKKIAPDDALQILDQLEGPITQKKVLESVELAESLRDSLKAWSNSPDEGIGRVQVLKRLKVQVEDVRGQNGSFVIPRVHLKTRIGRLKSEVESRLAIPAQLQRWFHCNEIKSDETCLEDMLDKNSQMVTELEVVLYLVTPETAGITGHQVEQMYENLQQDLVANDDNLASLSDESEPDDDFGQEPQGDVRMTSQANNDVIDADSDSEELVHLSDEFEGLDHGTPQLKALQSLYEEYGKIGTAFGAQDRHVYHSDAVRGRPGFNSSESSAASDATKPTSAVAATRPKIRPNIRQQSSLVSQSEAKGAVKKKVWWTCDVCSVATNRPHFKICELCGQGVRPEDFVIPSWYVPDQEESRKMKEEQMNERLTQSLILQQLEEGLNYAIGGDHFDNMEPAPPRRPNIAVTENLPLLAWTCDVCSVATNRPYFKICEVCGEGTRPDDFVIPNWYNPDKDEQKKLQQEDMNDQLTRDLLKAEEQRERQEADARYAALQRAENSLGCYPNYEPFECPVCAEDIGVGEGTILRLCHHCICNDCLKGHLNASENGLNVPCPYVDDNGELCEQLITQQEIRAALDEKSFEKLLQSAISQAEAAEPNSFHCKSPDCPGWCIVEDDLNFFDCANCGKRNCLTCAAQHHPMDCKQYQDDLKLKAANDEAAKATQDMLQRMLANGEAINCPGCKVIVQKKSGCDWMQCSMCKTEICWATRGPRWGPGGRGDTSGGCKCRAPNICHPNCGNCH